MEKDKWEPIIKQIRQAIDEKSFDKAVRLLKRLATQKGDSGLQQQVEEFKKNYKDYKKDKAQGLFSDDEVQNVENEIAQRLSFLLSFITGEALEFSDTEVATMSGEPAPELSEMSAPIEFEDISPIFDSIKIEAAPVQKSAPAPIRIVEPPVPMPDMAAPKPVKAARKSKAKPEPEPEQGGGILYNIPDKMQLGVQTKCVVRLAFDKKQLKRETDTFTDEVIKTVKVSEVMEIDLIDLSGENAFNIQFISQKEQFIDRNEATEWLIMVKALKAGSFSLALKVAIIERINDRDRRKEMVLEELVAVVSDNVAPSTGFKSASQPFQHVGAQTLLPNSNPSVKTVLFMGANPPGTQFLQLEIEHSRISVELEGHFRFPTAKFLSAAEMPKLFIIQKPNVVHFSGHGKDPSVNGDSNSEESGTRGIGLPKNYAQTGGIIVFDNDMRGMKIIEDKALDYIFSNAVQKLKIPIEVVVFNSCHSESQAKVVGKTVPYVVGTAHAIKDDIAISFAVGFYFGLANGLSVEDAFTSGKMQAVMEDLAAENLIVLYINGEKSSL